MGIPRLAGAHLTAVRLFVAIACTCAVLGASRADARVLLVRAKGAQIDEAVAAMKAELGATITSEMTVDEATSSAAVQDRATGNDLVIAVGARAAQLAVQQRGVPVVHCMVLQDAGGFDTDRSVGVPLAVSGRTRLDAMKRVVPKARKIGVLYDPRVNERAIEELEAAAKSVGVQLVKATVSSSTDAPAALDLLLPKIDALLVIPDATVVTKQLVTFLVARAFDQKLPVLAFSEALVRVGALAALAPRYADNGKLCARLAKRVLAGEKPGDLRGMVEMTGGLVVNTATARKIGVSLSADVLRAPTRVVGD